MDDRDQGRVGTRRVFYIPGYDPIHPRRYRELYRKEGARQAKLSGYEISIKPRHDKDNFGWSVFAWMDDCATRTEIEVLQWSDIVKSSMDKGIANIYWRMLRTSVIYMGSGALWRLMRLRKGPVIAAFYPVLMLLGQALVAALIVVGLYRAGTWLAPWFGIGGPLLGILIGIGLAWAMLDLFRRWDSRLFVYYLMHDYAYNASTRGAYAPELEARLESFTDTIAAAMQSDADEVLVIGHSSGAHLGISVLADLIRLGRAPADGPRIGFLSLGQVVPMVTFLPDAHRLRADLAFLADRDELFWVDVTAPSDGCAFALCDPVAVTGVAGPGKKWPIVFSAAFTQSLTPERWKALRWRFFRLHFQYLCAFDAPKDYDYFRITAGPRTLAARYRGRPASRSRIETPVNKFTATAP